MLLRGEGPCAGNSSALSIRRERPFKMSPELSPLGLEFDSESTSRSQDWRLFSVG